MKKKLIKRGDFKVTKYEIQQTVIKDIEDDEELGLIYNNFLKFGWSQEQVDNLRKSGFMQREGKVQGQMLNEIVRVSPKFKVIHASK